MSPRARRSTRLDRLVTKELRALAGVVRARPFPRIGNAVLRVRIRGRHGERIAIDYPLDADASPPTR